MRLLIRNARVISPDTGFDNQADIIIKDELIEKITKANANEPSDYDEVIDGSGLIAAPGLIDVHVHFRDPGLTYKEDIKTGALAAVTGGYTTVVMMANTKPVIDNEDTLKYVYERAEEVSDSCPLHILSAVSVTKGLQGKELSDMEKLIKLGAAGVTDDGIPIMNENLLEEAFKSARALNVPISLHEENPELISENGVNAGPVSKALGLKGSPREAEISMIERDLPIAERTGVDVNIQHISTKEGVELVRKARKRQLDTTGECHIHAEATPHHFSLTEEDVLKYKTLAKMNPPLRCEEDRLAIIEGLKDGTIEIIATDHAPHSKEEKERDFAKAPSGIIGLETALSLGITNLVKKGHLSIAELIEKMTVGPAKLYHLESGIAEGKRADIVLFDPDEEWVVNDFASKADNSPFKGCRLQGVVKTTICSGRISYNKKE